MTKAERIFKRTLQDCRIFLRNHPEEDGTIGFNAMTLEQEADQIIYTRTANEIRKYIEAEKKRVAFNKNIGLDVELAEKAIRMTEATLNNQYIFE